MILPFATPVGELTLVRHGETSWSLSGQHTSRTEVGLTEEGRVQARLLGRLLGEQQFSLVLVSPRRRAVETCQLAGLGESARTCEDLAEWDYGDYEGKTTDEIRATVPGWTVWTHPSPGGETAAEVAARADRIIGLVRKAGGDVAVFGHGHMLRVLAARWCELEATDGRCLALDPATMSILGYERATPVIRRWNQPVRSRREP